MPIGWPPTASRLEGAADLPTERRGKPGWTDVAVRFSGGRE